MVYGRVSRVPASVGAGTASGTDSGPVQIYNGGDAYSWHFMPMFKKRLRLANICIKLT